MAAIKTPMPGSQYGPCINECKHEDCEALKQEALQKCSICGKEIGYEAYWYNDHDHGPVHAVCLEDKILG